MGVGKPQENNVFKNVSLIENENNVSIFFCGFLSSVSWVHQIKISITG